MTDAAPPDAWMEEALAEIESLKPLGNAVVFVSGNFNVIHPGHLRLLNFAAECGDLLIVGVNADDMGVPLLPQHLRLEGVQSIGVVDYAFTLPVRPEIFIERLKPTVVVKGKEHEAVFNREQAAVESYGGKLLFCSGESRFSSFDLLNQELKGGVYSAIAKPADYPKRHGFVDADLISLVRRFADLEVAVIGDLIIDEYVTCDALGMSQEDPTLVVRPVKTDRFVGGAGIVAAHASGLKAKVHYFAVTGKDEIARYAAKTLKKFKVDAHLLEDRSRPTTLKQRFRAGDKTMLRVSHLRQHDISAELANSLFEQIEAVLDQVDLLVFSDFNYGVLPQPLVDRIVDACRQRGVMMVADSQASSQISDVSRFKGMRLLTPTEREARLAVHDTQSGLVILAEKLEKAAQADHVLLTLGAEGVLIHAPQEGQAVITDRLGAFNRAPKDVSGAGDSLLTCTAMALAVGADIWQAAYLGAVAAACQVGRVGNTPLTADELIQELNR